MKFNKNVGGRRKTLKSINAKHSHGQKELDGAMPDNFIVSNKK